jgi:hypothetical protein
LPKGRLITVSSVVRIIGPGIVTATPKGAADVVMIVLRSPRSTDVEVLLGVDTHLDFPVAVALDDLGRRLGESRVPTTTKGYKRLLCSGLKSSELLGALGLKGPAATAPGWLAT